MTITSKITTQDFIEAAMKMCGIKSVAITPDVTRTARQIFKMLLLHVANKGITLWTIEKNIIGLVPGQNNYALPSSTIDYLNVSYRYSAFANTPALFTSSAGGVNANLVDNDLNTFFTQTGPNGSVSYDFQSAITVFTVGMMAHGQQYYTLRWSVSDDNVTWTTILETERNLSFPDRQWVSFDIPLPREARYIKVEETGNSTLDLIQLLFGIPQSEIKIQAENLDSYSNLNLKSQHQRQPTTFWYDKRQTEPQLVVWPIPTFMMDQLVAWTYRAIQDTENLSDEIEAPERWYLALLNNLALRLLPVLPGADISRYTMIKTEAENTLREALAEEGDKSPMRLVPNIGPYTA